MSEEKIFKVIEINELDKGFLVNVYDVNQKREQQKKVILAFETKKEVLELIDNEIPSMGIRRWRQQIKKEGKNKAVVFIEDSYGIFYLAEIMILSGIRVKDIPPAAGTREDILRRYELLNPPHSDSTKGANLEIPNNLTFSELEVATV